MVVRIFKTFAPFLATFAFSVVLMGLLDIPAPLSSDTPTPLKTLQSTGSGHAWGTGSSSRSDGDVGPVYTPRGPDSPLRIISKPSARYTDAARINNVEGKVRLKVVLLASGHVGSITVVDDLPDGLTDQAIEAARNLRFEPATKGGVKVTKVITIDYGFTIY